MTHATDGAGRTIIRVPVADLVVSDRFRKDLGDLSGLMRSMKRLGQLQAVGVRPDGRNLIFGRRRHASAVRLGWEMIDAVVIETADDAAEALAAELHENTERLALKPTEWVALGQELERLERPRAAERVGGRPRKDAETGGKLPSVSAGAGKTRDRVGAAVGVSGKTFEKARRIAEAAAAVPPRYGHLPALMDERSVDFAYKEFRKLAPPPTPDRLTHILRLARRASQKLAARAETDDALRRNLRNAGFLVEGKVRQKRGGRKGRHRIVVLDQLVRLVRATRAEGTISPERAKEVMAGPPERRPR